MGYFKHLFDSDYRQREDIEMLRNELDSIPNDSAQLRAMSKRMDRLELLCEALVELVVDKGLGTQAELSVLMQQLDLEDGVEDGGRSQEVRHNAPRCANCDKFVNPKRAQCVYCNAPVQASSRSRRPPPRLVPCQGCGSTVAESSTFYTAHGLRCETCFAQMS